MNRLPSVSSLMSPPEAKPYDSFTSALSPSTSQQPSVEPQPPTLPPISADRKRTRSEMDLPSPPVTPYNGSKKLKAHDDDDDDKAVDDESSTSRKDPVLFPRTDVSGPSLTDEPLFGPELVPGAEALVDKHMASRPRRLHGKADPTRDEYLLALSCVPIVSTNYNRNPGAWAFREREILERQLSMMTKFHPDAANGLKKIAPAPTKKSNNNSTQRAPRSRPKRTPKNTPKQKNLDTFDGPVPAAAAKQARVIGTNRDDTDYNSLPDFSPPISSLRGNTKGLKADWKGQMLDLGNDPDRHLLDPAEVSLAATLRLSCATYLCSKRRIFMGRLNALKIGKDFRKTDAQQACKIDVNKASKLWTAYDRVGWFKLEHFQRHLVGQ